MNRRGFSLIEVLTASVIIGLLVSIAVPKYQLFRKRAEAADVVSAMLAVRTAAYSYNESNGGWPPATAQGTAPRGLGQYLPGAVSFTQNTYTLGWGTLAASVSRVSRSYQMLSMQTADGVLCQSVSGLWGGQQNVDLSSVCSANGGYVILFVDH